MGQGRPSSSPLSPSCWVALLGGGPPPPRGQAGQGRGRDLRLLAPLRLGRDALLDEWSVWAGARAPGARSTVASSGGPGGGHTDRGCQSRGERTRPPAGLISRWAGRPSLCTDLKTNPKPHFQSRDVDPSREGAGTHEPAVFAGSLTAFLGLPYEQKTAHTPVCPGPGPPTPPRGLGVPTGLCSFRASAGVGGPDLLDVPLGWGLSPHTWHRAWGGRRGAAGRWGRDWRSSGCGQSPG